MADAARPDVLCIGAVLWDVIGRTTRHMQAGDDVPGRIAHIPGGVALNAAAELARRGMRPAVLGAVGDEPDGCALVAEISALGIMPDWLVRDHGMPTDIYMAIEDAGGLIAAIADAHSLEAAGERVLAPLRDGRLGSVDNPWTGPVVLDGNLTQDLLATIADDAALRAADLRVIPASPGKAERLSPLITTGHATLYLNLAEAQTLAGRPCTDAAEAAALVVARGARRVLVTDGARAVALAGADGTALTALPPAVTIARVTGAGDCFMAAHLVAERSGADPPRALEAAVAAAAAHVSGAFA